MKRYEVKDENGNTFSNRNSVQFARSDAGKCNGTVYEVIQVTNGLGKRSHTWKFPTLD